MKLYRVSIQQPGRWGKKGSVYVVDDTKENALKYVSAYLKDGLEVVKICELAKLMGNRMFSTGLKNK